MTRSIVFHFMVSDPISVPHSKIQTKVLCSSLLRPARHIQNWFLAVYALISTEEPSHVLRNAHKVENMTVLFPPSLTHNSFSGSKAPMENRHVGVLSKEYDIVLMTLASSDRPKLPNMNAWYLLAPWPLCHFRVSASLRYKTHFLRRTSSSSLHSIASFSKSCDCKMVCGLLPASFQKDHPNI